MALVPLTGVKEGAIASIQRVGIIPTLSTPIKVVLFHERERGSKIYVVAAEGGEVVALPDGEHVGIEFRFHDGSAVRVALHCIQMASFMEVLFEEGLRGLHRIHQAQGLQRSANALMN
jgi:hypothetical protein